MCACVSESPSVCVCLGVCVCVSESVCESPSESVRVYEDTYLYNHMGITQVLQGEGDL